MDISRQVGAFTIVIEVGIEPWTASLPSNASTRSIQEPQGWNFSWHSQVPLHLSWAFFLIPCTMVNDGPHPAEEMKTEVNRSSTANLGVRSVRQNLHGYP